MKIFFIGCVDFSHKCLTKLLSIEGVQIVGIGTKSSSSINADFCDLTPIGIKHNIPHFYIDDINSASTLYTIDQCQPDVICCFGWSYLIKRPLLEKYPIIGYHPAKLPFNRGRHPIIWALVLGLNETASTFFLMDDGADSGNILSQKVVYISEDDNAQTLLKKITDISLKQLETICTLIKNKGANESYRDFFTKNTTPQNHALSNLWRKRSQSDGLIDFRMSSKAIYNLIRALSKPYIGAEVNYLGEKIKIWDSRLCKVDLPNIEYGKILQVSPSGILVKTYDQAILLTKHEFKKLPQQGEYL